MIYLIKINCPYCHKKLTSDDSIGTQAWYFQLRLFDHSWEAPFCPQQTQMKKKVYYKLTTVIYSEKPTILKTFHPKIKSLLDGLLKKKNLH